LHFLSGHSAKQLSANSKITADTKSNSLENGNGSGFSLIYKGGACGRLMPSAVVQPEAALPVLTIRPAEQPNTTVADRSVACFGFFG
jgi:hypothetical protein